MENVSELKDKFFNRLLTQLKINEEHHQSQEHLMLEMYLVHNFSNASTQPFKQFIDIIKDETEDRLQIKSGSDNDVSNVVLRRDTFKRLFKSTKILYDILRAMLQNTFSEKYSYLLLDEIALGAVKKAASFLNREDYFWVAFIQLGFKKAFNWNDLHDAVFECASLNTADAAELNLLKSNHPLLKSISTNWFWFIRDHMERNVFIRTIYII
jgi:hypothetical protein